MGEKYEVRKKSDGGYTVKQVPSTAEQIGGGIVLIYLLRWPLMILFGVGGTVIVCIFIYQLITMPFTAKPPAKTVLQQSTAAGNSVIATAVPSEALSQAAAQEPTQAITAPTKGRITQNVKLHNKPGIDEPTVIVLKAGTEVMLTGDSVTTADGITWNKVQVGQQEGWCSAKYISPINQAAQSAAGTLDITGKWEGVISNPENPNVFLDFWQLTQTGTDVDGTVRVEIQGNPAAHVSKRLHGTITNGVFQFEELSFIETGNRPGEGLKWCLSSGEVHVKTDGDRMILEGTFGAGHGSDACPAKPTATVRAQKKP